MGVVAPGEKKISVTKIVHSGSTTVPTTCSRTEGRRSVVQQKQWQFSLTAGTKNTTDDKNSPNLLHKIRL